jgi:hypothetical protein
MPELSVSETEVIFEYARRKFAKERFPLAPALRPIREALEKLSLKPVPIPKPPAKPYVPPSWRGRNARRR